MDSLLVILFSYFNSIAFEGVISSVGYNCGIILIHRVSCYMHGHILTFVFHICNPLDNIDPLSFLVWTGGDASLRS